MGALGTGADRSPFRVKPELLKLSMGPLTLWVTGREKGCPPPGLSAFRNAGSKEQCCAWYRKALGTGVSGDLTLERGNARSPGKRGSAAQNAVALLVHRAGLEQQRNTEGKVSRREHLTRHSPRFVLGTQAGPQTPPPQPAAGGRPLPRAQAGLDSPAVVRPRTFTRLSSPRRRLAAPGCQEDRRAQLPCSAAPARRRGAPASDHPTTALLDPLGFCPGPALGLSPGQC